MSDIQLHRTVALTPVAKAIQQSVRVFDSAAPAVAATLAISISKAYIDAGVSADKQPRQEDNNRMVNELTAYVLENYGSLRINEIPLAINKGVLKEYGDYYGLNKVTFVTFLRTYYMSEERRRNWEAHIRAQEKETPIIPDLIKQFKTAVANTLDAYSYHLSGQPLATRGVIAYDFLNTLQLIPYTAAEKKQILEEAKKRVIAEKGNELFNSDMFSRLAVQKSLDDLKAGKHGEKEQAEIVAKAKVLTACRYFTEVNTNKVDLGLELEKRRDIWIQQRSIPAVEID